MRVIKKDVFNRLEKAMKEIGRDWSPVLVTQITRSYANAQARRFESANSTESPEPKWKALNGKYAAYKRQKFAAYPGGGKVIGIRTGRLYDASTLKNKDDSRAFASGRGLWIQINVPYAKYFDETRTISRFGENTRKEWKGIISRFIRSQVKGGA